MKLVIATDRLKIYPISLDKMKEIVETLSFKGIDEKGVVEIGYGINDGYENKGYMTEAVKALAEWASKQPNVKQIEAEAEETNIASIRVLEKSNFVPNGIMGQEGPRYIWRIYEFFIRRSWWGIRRNK